MEKRLIFVFVFGTLAAVAWLSVVNYQHREKEVGTATAEEAAEAPKSAEGAPPAPDAAKEPAAAPASGKAVAEQTVELDNAPYFKATLSNRGATFERFLLLDPQYAQEAKTPPAGVPEEKVAAGPLDLVSTWSPEYYPFKFEWTRFEGPEEAKALAAEWKKGPVFSVVERTDKAVTFVWPDPKTSKGSIFVEKRYTLSGSYAIDLEVTLYNLGATDLTTQFAFRVYGWQQPDASQGGMFSPRPDLKAGSCMAGGDVEREDFHALLEEPETLTGQVQWAAVDSRYFLLAALPRNLANSQCTLGASQVGVITATIHETQPAIVSGSTRPCYPAWLDRNDGTPKCAELSGKLGVGPDATSKQLADAYATAAMKDPSKDEELQAAYDTLRARGGVKYDFALYVGPKDIDLLKQAGESLTEALDFGILSFLAVPMLYILRTAHTFIPSWAIAIVMLTVLVKLLLLPLTHKSFSQMNRMQKLRPEMDKLREQYGSDKQKLNQAMLALYKSHKVNPMGGCLPMLLQMPVYIALYQTIYHSVELYQAPLFGWVRDLSAPDPFYVLPLILGATMFVQQKVTPTSMDSKQARMMTYIMPVMFTVFMLFLPSGLVLYIFVNTILTMIQQYTLQRKMA